MIFTRDGARIGTERYSDDMRRLALAPATVVAVLALSGCASSSSSAPAPDSWFDEAAAVYDGNPDVLGTVGLRVANGSAEGADGSGGTSDEGVTLSFTGPNRVTTAEVVCTGGGTAHVMIAVTTAAASDSVDADVPCDDATHTIDLGTFEDATGVTVDATADAEVALLAAILGSKPVN